MDLQKFELETGGEVGTVIPNLNINDSARFNVIGETEVTISSDMIIMPMAELRIDGTAGYGKEVQARNKFVQEGTLRMNLFRESTLGFRGIRMYDTTNVEQHGEQCSTGDSDLINVEGGTIELKDSSKLDLATNDAFGDLDTFKWRAFKLMKYGRKGSYRGNFGTVTLVGTLPKSYIVRYDYLGEYIALLAEGYAMDEPKFASLATLNICFNQTQVAKTLDYFYSEAYGGTPGEGTYTEQTARLGGQIARS